ncbi:MAG TPA: Clp protease N-terminal domain-containing protein, partial [Flexilinea sp.]|nr:Clp protease N-terminal domain-containing protein [Flexilinea sp.]
MMRFDRFTESAQDAAQRAVEILQRYGQNQIDTEHFLLALIEQPQGTVSQILDEMNVSTAVLSDRLDYMLRTSTKTNIYGGGSGQIFITPNVRRIVDQAYIEANRLKDEYTSTEHIFLAILNEKGTPVAKLMEEFGITRAKVYEIVVKMHDNKNAPVQNKDSRYKNLQKYSRDLTDQAREGKLDPV